MPAPTYIISKVADPIFAVFIGLSAAATRINREEKEKGVPTSETVAAGKRRLAELSERILPSRRPTSQSISSDQLQDYQMQLMRLEQQNKLRSAAAQNEKKG